MNVFNQGVMSWFIFGYGWKTFVIVVHEI